MTVTSRKKNLVKFFYHIVGSIWNKFANTVWKGPIVFQAPLTFFLPEHFDLLGRRLWPDVLESDNTRYEEITKEYLSLLDDEEKNKDVYEGDQDDMKKQYVDDDLESENESQVALLDGDNRRCKKKSESGKELVLKKSIKINKIRAQHQPLMSDQNALHNVRELLEKYPEWNVTTLTFIKRTFQLFSNSVPGLLTKQEFLKCLARLGDSTPKLAILSRYTKLSYRSSFGEGISLVGIFEYIYNSKSSIEKPNTALNTSKYHLRKKVADLADLSQFITDLAPDDTIHYGYC